MSDVLATVDTAMRSGFAVGPIDSPTPLCGVWVLNSKWSYGQRFAAFANELISLIDAWEPKWLVRATPLVRPTRRKRDTVGGPVEVVDIGQARARLLLGLDAMVESVCYRKGIICLEQPEQTIRASVLRKGWMKEPKKFALEFCKSQGIETGGDDNVADAAVTWVWAAAELRRKQMIERAA